VGTQGSQSGDGKDRERGHEADGNGARPTSYRRLLAAGRANQVHGQSNLTLFAPF